MPQFHVDLSHVANTSGLKLEIGTDLFDLTSHDDASRADAVRSHPTLGLLPETAHKRLTHFVQVPDVHLPPDELRWLRVIKPQDDPQVFVPEIHLVGLYLPPEYLRAYYRRKLKANPGWRHPKLVAYGLEQSTANLDDAVEAHVSAMHLVTTFDTAGNLVFHHPELANVQPYTTTIVMNDHVSPSPDENPDQYNAIKALSNVIGDPSNQPWSPVIPCKDHNGNLLKAGYAIGDAIAAGQQLYTHSLTDATLTAALPASQGARRTAYNDPSLQNQIWSVQPGTTTLQTEQNGSNGSNGSNGAKAARSPGVRASGVDFDWTVNELTPHHGLSVNSDSIHIDGSDNFSIDASNSYLRTLYAYYQLFDENQKALGGKTAIQSLSAVNTIMGIPMPTDPTTLSFNLKGASSVNLLFGGFGTSAWDMDVSPRGALLTGLWQYGIPGIFLVAGKALTSTSTFNKIVNDKELTLIAVALGLPIVGAGVSTAAALANTKTVLIGFADVVIGLVVQKGLEALGTWLLTQVAAGQIANAFGPVGWIFKLVSAGLDFEEMAVTTGEILSSPATLKVAVSRTINVSLTLHPDPKHGESGDPKTAVWPALAQQYIVTLQYKDGTTRQLKGSMLPTTNSDPIVLDFQAVPAGGQLRVIAGVYSNSGWLAGSWQSDWQTAKPTSGDTLVLGDQNIKENLVPLAPNTQYVYKEQIAFQNNDYVWEVGSPPTTTVTGLNNGNSGTLSELVGITINNSAFQIGYAFRASGQNIPANDPDSPPTNDQLYALQNLSVLADPGSRLKFSQIGFTNQPSITYSPSVNKPNEIDQNNFIVEPLNGVMNLRQVTLSDGSHDFGLTKPDLPSWGQFPLPALDAIAVHSSSNAVIGVSWKDNKMLLLSLPDTSGPDADAPVAVLVSGEGIRQGLMQGPKALAVAPDGRILILESINQRIQAFDVKGNPVPSFIQQPKLFSLNLSDVAAGLDAGNVPDALQQAFQINSITLLFLLDPSFSAQLDSGTYQPTNDPLIQAFSLNGVFLSYDPEQLDNKAVSTYITVNQPGASWTITDPGKKLVYQIENQSGDLWVFRPVVQFQVQQLQAGQRWILTDTYAAATWLIQPTFGVPTQVDVFAYLSTTPLYNPSGLSDITYLDMAVEAQGNIYVLSYTGDGSQSTDYFLDVYGPNGEFLFRTPDSTLTTSPQNVVAAKIAVDIWRNLYTLNYEQLPKPSGTRTEPGIAHWMPTPPLFTLPLSDQSAFDSRNISVVSQGFAANGITLSPNAFIQVHSDAGYYEVKDLPKIYNVFRSGDGLQVYAIPA